MSRWTAVMGFASDGTTSVVVVEAESAELARDRAIELTSNALVLAVLAGSHNDGLRHVDPAHLGIVHSDPFVAPGGDKDGAG